MHKLSKYSWATAAGTLVVGFMLLHTEFVNYGGGFFVAFPCAVGFALGTHPPKERGIGTIILALLVFFGFLLAGALEGLVCVAMALPIFLVMMLIGWAVRKYLFRDKPREKSVRDHLLVSVAPLLVLVFADRIEGLLYAPPEVVEIETAVLLDHPAPLVFDMVKQMDKLDAEKPWGIWLGLPAPYRCVLEADTVGAKRHCLFDNGHILAEITHYDHGNLLEMDVVEYTLTGREWFEFVDATYSFARVGGRTRITRTSSYRSSLRPRWYWDPLEGWGIAEEHAFVLASLRKNLAEHTGTSAGSAGAAAAGAE